jgi:hypothetical protein
MDRATDRIEQHLDQERQALRSNLEELEDRVKSVVDWRRQFRGNTAAFLGLALAGGLLIGLMTARRAETLAPLESPMTPAGQSATAYREHRWRALSMAWRTIESALIGVAAAKLKDTLANLLPGVREELAEHQGDGYEPGSSRRYHR